MQQRFWLSAALAAQVICLNASAAEARATTQFDLPSQSLAVSLRSVGSLASVNVLFDPPLVEGLSAPAIKGEFTTQAAFEQLLIGTGLKLRFIDERTVMVFSERAGADIRGIPEVLVTGSRVLNMDIRRSRDDPQPYTIFDQSQIEHSGAGSVEDFLKSRLTMNSQAATLSQSTLGSFANNSQINLRGLGASQTLILVDGRRQPGFPNFGDSAQSDLNGIPLAAIERIEVLPTTASGIYGGSATGGVINVIMRRDYEGAEIGVKYEDSFSSDAPNQRVDAAAGFNLMDGKTNVLIAGSYMEGEQPRFSEYRYWERGRAAILANTNNNYGALDASGVPVLGSTTNIRSANGANLVLDSGLPLGSSITHVPTGYAGVSSDAGAALAAQAGSYNIEPPDTLHTIGGNATRMGQDPQLKSLSLTVRQEIADDLSLFFQASASQSVARFQVDATIGQTLTSFRLPAAAPANPFQQDIVVQVPLTSDALTLRSETETRGLAGGLIYKLPGNWVAGLDYSWGRSELDFLNVFAGLPTTLAAAVNAGTIDVFRDAGINVASYLSDAPPGQGHYDVTLRDTSLRFAGPLWELPGGDMQLSLLGEYREELLGNGLNAAGVGGTFTAFLHPSRSQSVRSAYAELRLPWVSSRNRMPGIEALELQLAVRRDDYTIRGSTSRVALGADGMPVAPIVRHSNEVASTDPTIALLYQPLRDVTLRASYGTGFLPPSVGQVVPAAPIISSGGVDPLRGNTIAGTLIYTSGGNPDLKPEDSKSWSMGAIFTPAFVPRLRLSLDYTKIRKTNNISAPSTDTILNFFPERVTRGPNLPDDPAGWAGPVIAIDATLLNVAKAEVEAFDLQVDYEFDTAFGRFAPFILASRQTHFLQQFTPQGAMLEYVGVTSSNPPKLKANGGFNWSVGNWSAGWAARYFDSYTAGATAQVNLRQGRGGRVSSQTYHDVFAAYRFSAGSSMFDATQITLGIKNLFDKEPPFDANLFTVGYYSTFGDARLARYWLSVKKNF